MSEQDKRRAELMRAIDEYVNNCVGAEHSLCAEPSSARINAAIDALLGDVVATYPKTVMCPGPGDCIYEVEDYPAAKHAVFAEYNYWEVDICKQLDPNTTYEMTISLRRVVKP